VPNKQLEGHSRHNHTPEPNWTYTCDSKKEVHKHQFLQAWNSTRRT